LKNSEETTDYLLISGIQHFVFCKHQWGLIHIESAWENNALTFEGSSLHERVDDPEIMESRGNIYYSRGVAVSSDILGMQGVIDVIEFVRNKEGIYIEEKKDYYFPRIIEYKRGVPKEGLEDKIQLTALAMAFEEMKGVRLEEGFLFYFGTKKREKVRFSEDLRKTVASLAEEMHAFFDKRLTPPPEKKPCCRSCSLEPVCSYRFGVKDAKKYIRAMMEDN